MIPRPPIAGVWPGGVVAERIQVARHRMEFLRTKPGGVVDDYIPKVQEGRFLDRGGIL
jgi:hypothetical protein